MLPHVLPRHQLNLWLPLLAWEVVVAVTAAQGMANTLLGRTMPLQAPLGWTLATALVSGAVLLRLVWFSRRAYPILRSRPCRPLSTLALIQAPLLALSLAITLMAYLSDDWYHHFITLLHPAPTVMLLLVLLLTAAAQEILILNRADRGKVAVLPNLAVCRRWATPISLTLLGLLQGASYLWVIGNDFTRYWAIADAIGSMAGYPATRHQPIYLNAGMYLYSIELPGFPLLLLLSFSLFGHDTVGAHVPALAANVALPLLLYGLYTRAGLGRPLAFAASCAVVVLPPFRLYTLNAPVPDAVFVALLVGTAYLFLGLTRKQTIGTGERSGIGGPAATAWLLFGLLAGLTTLTRPEGLLFAGMMFVALAPDLLRPRFYLAVLSFLAAVTPFSLLMLNSFGLLWPRNFGTSASINNVAHNLQWLEKYSVRWYAEPLDLSASGFALMVGLLTVAAIAGTLWLAARRWQVAVLPLAAALHIGFVFTIDPRVSGADQWFDFFRHISYGIPFLALSILFLADRSLQRLRFRPGPAHALALLVLLVSAYELRTLAFPSRSYGSVGRQLLTSDVWVSMHDIVANRYALPTLTSVQREGVLVPDFESRYMLRHARSVISHFEPVSSLSTGRGAGYQLSSLLVVLFGAVFVFARAARDPPGTS